MRTFRHYLALGCLLSVLSFASLPCWLHAQAQTTTETFESGTKTSYAIGNVTLSTGIWSFDDALIGNLSTDRKTGTASARVRNTGQITMSFDAASSSTISVQHAIFGTDGSSTWELWASTTGGATYSKVGSTVSTTSTSLVTATFTFNSSTPVRFSFRKTSGGANRINFDNVNINPASGGGSTGEHLTMGNPTNATVNTGQPTNYLLDKPQYAASYNRDLGRPNWVSWHLSSNWIGSVARQNDFRNDTTLPAGWYQVQGTDYTGSGFDRGHYCPSGDRTNTVADNSATFLMTNMMPQAPDNNQGPWEALESYCRTLVSSGNELYIVAGGSGSGGTGSNGFATTIAGGHVGVPSQTWKVIIVLPNASGNDVTRVTTSTRTIAVIMPNQQGIRANDWHGYRVSVDQVESLTGYDFFSNLPASIQSVIEARVDNIP
ncbi:MAG: DNA/RNA non-specific endonuclease [Acidobacteria bacterium]|nr:DNA/RNA non-specific endonuclease [Acidobacteriota bacterium]